MRGLVGGLARGVSIALVVALLGFASACGGHKQARVKTPPPPAIPSVQTEAQTQSETTPPKGVGVERDAGDLDAGIPAGAKPIYVETGTASWYGPPYHNRKAANGEVYNMNAMTAAHLTLPLGSIVRVTNSKTGRSALVRINDRGPFVLGRIVDLSMAAAKAIDVYRAGIAPVRLEVLKAPAPLDTGGRWTVQIGSIAEEGTADELVRHLARRYHSAKVQSFESPAGGWWVRVRVAGDDRVRAQRLVSETRTSEGKVFLVRVD